MDPVVELTVTPSDIEAYFKDRRYSSWGMSFNIKSEDGILLARDWLFLQLCSLNEFLTGQGER